MSKPRILSFAAFITLILATIVSCVANPLRRSEASIRASLLRQTPLGSRKSEVRTFLESRGWLDRDYVGTTGYSFQPAGQPRQTIGVSSLCGDLWHYGVLFRTDVTAFWGFDAGDRLIDVAVSKCTDALWTPSRLTTLIGRTACACTPCEAGIAPTESADHTPPVRDHVVFRF